MADKLFTTNTRLRTISSWLIKPSSLNRDWPSIYSKKTRLKRSLMKTVCLYNFLRRATFPNTYSLRMSWGSLGFTSTRFQNWGLIWPLSLNMTLVCRRRLLTQRFKTSWMWDKRGRSRKRKRSTSMREWMKIGKNGIEKESTRTDRNKGSGMKSNLVLSIQRKSHMSSA